MEIIELSRKGLPKHAADILSKGISLTDREMAKILNLSERTFHRYREDTMFDTATTERLLQLVSLYQKGEEVFESLENFKRWMRRSLRIFENKTPLDLLDTATGFQLVEDELERIDYGVYV